MCVNRIFRPFWNGLLSLFVTSSLPDVEPLTKEERKSLVDSWPKLKEKNPDLFLRAWIKSARMSVNIKKATGLREDEDPAANGRFISLAPYIEDFVDKLIIEFRCNDSKVAEACRKLGARHVLVENFHINFWDIFLGNLIQIIIEAHPEREQREIAAICEKFFAFFVNFMRDGYKTRVQEQLSGRRHMNT
uniref:GLOBIN domain-containing protein n=1 Tax=Elaeophora elaphi TaxID=1147741 RepID=A0A0R3RMN6_9BILA